MVVGRVVGSREFKQGICRSPPVGGSSGGLELSHPRAICPACDGHNVAASRKARQRSSVCTDSRAGRQCLKMRVSRRSAGRRASRSRHTPHRYNPAPRIGGEEASPAPKVSIEPRGGRVCMTMPAPRLSFRRSSSRNPSALSPTAYGPRGSGCRPGVGFSKRCAPRRHSMPCPPVEVSGRPHGPRTHRTGDP